MTTREIRKLLHDDGWIEIRQKGSHLQFEHPNKKGLVTGPCTFWRYSQRNFEQHFKAGKN